MVPYQVYNLTKERKAQTGPDEEGPQRQDNSPCRDLAVVHIGRDNDPKLAFAPLRDKEAELGNLRL